MNDDLRIMATINFWFIRYYCTIFLKNDPNENIGFHNVVDGGSFQRKIEILAHIVIYGIGTTRKICNLHRM